MKTPLPVLSVLMSFVIVAMTASAAAGAAVPRVDGKLGDAVWKAAAWTVGETCDYALHRTADTLYLAVRCRERDPQGVTLAFAPEGSDFNVYHFTISPAGVTAAFTSEKGNIRPDPYAPVWRAASGEENGKKTVELALPYSAFYMTRNAAWKTTWLVGDGQTLKSVPGFPPRAEADDVALTDVDCRVTGRAGGKIASTLTVRVHVAVSGDYTLNGAPVALKKGWNAVMCPQTYTREGRCVTRLTLVRVATKETYARDYPVLVDARPIRVKLTKPQYRDNFYPGQNADAVEGAVEIADGTDAVLTLEGPGFPTRTAEVKGGKGTFRFDTRGFQTGDAKLTVRTVAATPDELAVKIRNLPPSGHRMVWIEDGKLVLNGKKVFRRNIYSPGYRGGKAFDEFWKREAPKFHLTPEFTCGAGLDLSSLVPKIGEKEAKADVKPSPEFFAALEKRVLNVRDRDFGFYYFNDEPECRGVSPVYLRSLYERLKELDPYHPAMMSSRSPTAYIDCCDWFESHPYINPVNEADGTRTYGRPINELGRWIDMIGDLKRPDKAIGFLPTCFAYRAADLSNDYPTFPEYDCHVWAALVRGAVSMNPYAYHDMGDRPSICEGTRYVYASIEALEDFFLEGTRTTLRRDFDCEAELFAKTDEKLLAVVNFRERPIDIDVGALLKKIGETKMVEFRGDRVFAAEMAPVTLPAHFVLLATTKKRGADLPTFAQEKSRIDALEYKRTHRDNQLVEKYDEVTCAYSNAGTAFYKLIDGVRCVYAWSHSWGKCPYVEFSKRRGRFAFSRLKIFGTGFYDVKVDIRKDGEWKTVPTTTVKKEKFVRELDFGEVLTTVRIRISFPPPKGWEAVPEVELYEIELPYVKGAAEEARAVRSAPKREVKECWRHDAKTVKSWTGPGTAAPRADGGFVISGENNVPVRFEPGYRWFEAVPDDFKIARRGYLSWALYFWGGFGGYQFGAVSVPIKGIYTQRLPSVTATRKSTMKIYDYNFDIGFKYLRLVDEPENWLLAETPEGKHEIGPGDTIKVTFKTADPCEEVSVQFLVDHQGGSGYSGFSVNGSSDVTMKRLDPDGCLWGGEVLIKSCRASKPGAVCLRATALGGNLDTPIYTQLSAVKFVSKVP